MTDIELIINKTRELGKLIAQSDEAKAFAAAKLAYDENPEIQDLNGQFNLHKMSIAVISKQDNPDEERIAQHEQQLKEVYDKIMSSDVMTEYQKRSQAIEQLVAQVNNIINFYVTGGESGGCSGSCATCGGCGGK